MSGIGLFVTISEPHVREDGKLVITFNVCGTCFDREIDGTKYSFDGERWKLIDPDGK